MSLFDLFVDSISSIFALVDVVFASQSGYPTYTMVFFWCCVGLHLQLGRVYPIGSKGFHYIAQPDRRGHLLGRSINYCLVDRLTGRQVNHTSTSRRIFKIFGITKT